MTSEIMKKHMDDDLKEFKKQGPQGKLRLTLSSCTVSLVSNVVEILKSRASDQDIRAVGPMRMPVKTLRITTRKTPCGEGSKTWDRYQMRIHKWVLDIYCKKEDIKELLSVHFPDGVKIRVTVSDYE